MPLLSSAASRARRPIVAVFVVIVTIQLALAAVSLDVLSAVRAYVAGESLYSKGQKDAHIHLLDYLADGHEADHEGFLRALAVPHGDRSAREALEQRPAAIEAARHGFLAGGNHADDIDGMIRLFVWFRHLPFMARPIATCSPESAGPMPMPSTAMATSGSHPGEPASSRPNRTAPSRTTAPLTSSGPRTSPRRATATAPRFTASSSPISRG